MLVAYHAEFSHCNVPQRFVRNKIKCDGLGDWVAEQHTKRDALEDNQEHYLSKLGLWEVSAKRDWTRRQSRKWGQNDSIQRRRHQQRWGDKLYWFVIPQNVFVISYHILVISQTIFVISEDGVSSLEA